MEDIIMNNKVNISGRIIGDFEYSHEMFGEKFYTNTLEVDRMSANCDYIRIMVSERLCDVSTDWKDIYVSINGQFRSHNIHIENKSKLELSVFVRDIEVLDNVACNNNHIELDGYLCMNPIYRKTPLGREIGDLILAVNRPYGKSDYIPCICWGKNARFISTYDIGARFKIIGRIQSREYVKKISETESEKRIAYEVSVAKLEVVEEEKND